MQKMAVKNSLQKTGNNAPSQKLTISGYLSQEKIKTWINGMIGSEKEAQKFISSIISATSTTPALQACEPTTIVSSALLANALDLSLSPQLGLAYMVPFEDNKNGRTVATFILGYKGYIQLAIRSGKYRKINVVAVKEGEFVSYNPLTEDLQVNLIADDEERERAATVGYYAYFELVNGFQKVVCDALNKIAYKDDTQVVEIAACKWYGTEPMLRIDIDEVQSSYSNETL